MAVTKEQIIDQLRRINEPELHRDLVTLNMIKGVAVCDGVVAIKIELPTPTQAIREQIQNEIKRHVSSLPGVKEVTLDFNPHSHSHSHDHAHAHGAAAGTAAANSPLPGVKHIIAVGAGKGGVGKSTVSVNLAVGLARQGLHVGLLDGDIYGPSVPTLLGINGIPPRLGETENSIEPFFVHGIKSMTIGALVEADRPLIWRGPMAHGAFRDLATRTNWNVLDYLIIDLPPGTGDVPLTMSQLLPLTGAVVVCTPQKVAQDDARRAVRMFQQLKIEVLGIVENMSFFIGDDGKEYDIFGRGGAQHMAQDMGVPFLGAIPIHMALRANSDSGNPTANFTGPGKLASELESVVRALQAQVTVQTMSATAGGPKLTIS